MIELDLQIATEEKNLPTQDQFNHWVNLVLKNFRDSAELTIRIVDNSEMAELNKSYRKKSGPTNVLSFPANLPDNIDIPLLGDIVISAPKVISEAEEQNKNLTHHWAHLVIHGLLHLLGYDHIDHSDAEIMENLEVSYLSQLDIPNPYEAMDTN